MKRIYRPEQVEMLLVMTSHTVLRLREQAVEDGRAADAYSWWLEHQIKRLKQWCRAYAARAEKAGEMPIHIEADSETP